MKEIIDYFKERNKELEYDTYKINDKIQQLRSEFSLLINEDGYSLADATMAVINDIVHLAVTNNYSSIIGFFNGYSDNVYKQLTYPIRDISRIDNVIAISTGYRDKLYIKYFVFEDKDHNIIFKEVPRLENSKSRCKDVKVFDDYFMIQLEDESYHLFRLDDSSYVIPLSDFIGSIAHNKYSINNPLINIKYVNNNIIAINFHDVLEKGSPEYMAFMKRRYKNAKREDLDNMQKDVSSKMDENEYIKKYKDKDLYLAIRNREDTEGMNQDELDVKKYYDILQSKIQNKDKILMYFDINKKDIINEFVNCSHIHTFKEHYAIVSEDTVKHIDVTEIDLTKEDEGIRLNIIPINGGDNKGKLKYLFTSNKKTIINKVKGEDLLSIIEPDVSSDTSHNHNMQFFTVEGNEVIKDQFTTDSIPVEISYSIDYGILCLDYHSRNVKQKLYFYKDNGSDIIVSKMDLVLDTEFDLKDILTRWKRHITTVDNDIYQILADRLALIINQQELYGDHDKEMSVTTMKINGAVYHDIENVLMETGRLVVHEYNDESRDYFIRKLRT